MNPQLSDFTVNIDDIKAPRYWRLEALYESPLAIAVRMSPDPGQFLPERARDTLLQWLTTVEHTARATDVVRPVVGCIEVSDKKHEQLLRGWENDARWRTSGLVVYVERWTEESKSKDIEDRLERVLFRTVDEAILDDDKAKYANADTILEEHIKKSDSLSTPVKSLLNGFCELLQYRKNKAKSMDLKAGAHALMDAWQKNIAEAPVVGGLSISTTGSAPGFHGGRQRVDRVTNVDITHFRGWCGKDGHSADVNADLVLLVGPNGHGKSTFLEALVLGLTGYTRHEKPDALRPRKPNGDKPIDTKIEIQACKGESHKLEPICFTLPIASSTVTEDDADAASALFPTLPRSTLWDNFYSDTGSAKDAAIHEMNLCTVFADQLHERFDLGKSTDKLFGAFSSAGTQIGILRSVAEEQAKGINEKIDTNRNKIRLALDAEKERETRTRVLARFASARPIFDEFFTQYAHFEKAGPALPPWVNILETNEDPLTGIYAALDAWVGALRIGGRQRLSKWITDQVETWKEKLIATSARAIDRSYDVKKQRLARLKSQYAGAAARVSPFVDVGGNVPIDKCLDALARNLDRWRKAGHDAGLRELAEQLDRVIPADLHRLCELARKHVGDARRATEEMVQLTREIDELERQAQRAERFQRLRDIERSSELATFGKALDERANFEALIRDVKRLEEENEKNEKIIEALDEAERALDPVLLHPGLREAFEKVLNDVLGRIQLSPGIVPVEINEKTGHVKTADHRVIDDLSTGQKTQLAVALSVGINLAVSSKLGTGVLAMDDVSAAYDVSNIAREALFWRTVAYGHCARNLKNSSDNSDKQRRQLFLSSHNETTTQQLIDLLRPPANATMKVVRLTGWNNESGPSFDVQEVRCSRLSEPDTRNKLAREIRLAQKRNP